MTAKNKRFLGYLVMGFIAALAATFFFPSKKEDVRIIQRDFPEIKVTGVLNAVTEYNSIGYFVERDSIVGFQHDMIRKFAEANGLKIKLTPEMSLVTQFEGLSTGKYDLIVNNIPITSEFRDSFLLTNPIVLNKQVLIQRKATEVDSAYISSQLDLANKTIYVPTGSPSIFRIQNLSNEIADTIYIKEIERYGSEQLMAMVAHGDIDYAVCDEKIALASIHQYPQLDINMDISFTQFYSWAIDKRSPILLDSINNWLNQFLPTKEYKEIYRRYYTE